jgi:hypothetical protein
MIGSGLSSSDPIPLAIAEVRFDLFNSGGAIVLLPQGRIAIESRS